MGLFNIFDVAGSALNAQTLRLNTTASNLANANSASSSTDTVYKSRQPIFATMISNEFDGDNSSVGVQVLGIVEKQEPSKAEYNPGHPLANEDGYVYMPNVNVIEEMTNMISASRSYQTNVEVMNTAKQMLMRTLSLGQ
ncbi:MAG: flagellar basal body rod protein FlgC [Woeseiaceae bacterium]